MISPKHLNRIKNQATATILFLQNPNTVGRHQKYAIRQNIIFTKLGLELAIEAYEKYTNNKSPILDELNALREDLLGFEKIL